MKKILPVLSALVVLMVSACGSNNSSKASVAPSSAASSATSVAPSSVAPSSAASSAAASSSQAPAHTHAWVKGTDTKNADDKTLSNYTCACGAVKVEIAITDASTGASDIGSDGKLGKGKTFAWKFVAPKAGNAMLQFCVKYGQSSVTEEVSSTIWGKSGSGQLPYTVTVGQTAGTVLVNEKQYDETGVTAEGAYIDFATVAVTQGENVVTLVTPTDQYYRNCFINNVALIIEA